MEITSFTQFKKVCSSLRKFIKVYDKLICALLEKVENNNYYEFQLEQIINENCNNYEIEVLISGIHMNCVHLSNYKEIINDMHLGDFYSIILFLKGDKLFNLKILFNGRYNNDELKIKYQIYNYYPNTPEEKELLLMYEILCNFNEKIKNI